MQLKLACFFDFSLNYDTDNKLRKIDEYVLSVRVQAGVRDRPAWTTRGWLEDREVGRSVCTSLAPEPEGAMGLECQARLQGGGRGEICRLIFQISNARLHAHTQTSTSNNLPINGVWVTGTVLMTRVCPVRGSWASWVCPWWCKCVGSAARPENNTTQGVINHEHHKNTILLLWILLYNLKWCYSSKTTKESLLW